MRLVNAITAPAPTRTAAVVVPAQRSTLTPRAISSALYTDLLGKPYKDSARGRDAYDCVGLALEMARRMGKQLPDYLSSEAELHAQLGSGGATLAGLAQIPHPVPGCIVLLRMGPNKHHVGVMLDEYRMIHTSSVTGCVIERVISQLWQRKVIGFYSL